MAGRAFQPILHVGMLLQRRNRSMKLDPDRPRRPFQHLADLFWRKPLGPELNNITFGFGQTLRQARQLLQQIRPFADVSRSRRSINPQLHVGNRWLPLSATQIVQDSITTNGVQPRSQFFGDILGRLLAESQKCELNGVSCRVQVAANATKDKLKEKFGIEGEGDTTEEVLKDAAQKKAKEEVNKQLQDGLKKLFN